MKKSAFFLFLLLSTLGSSQGLRILRDSTDVTGKTIVQKIGPDGEYFTPLTVYNSTADTKEFFAKRLLSTKLDSDYMLLFGLEKTIFVSSLDSVQAPSLPFIIKPHEYFRPGLDYGLTSALYSGAICRDHVVTYILTDTLHQDSATVTIQYTCSTASSIRILKDTTDVTGTTVTEYIEPGIEYKTDFRLYNSTDQKKTFAVSRILPSKLAKGYYVYFGVDNMHFSSSEDSVYSSSAHGYTYTIDAKSYLPVTLPNFGLTSFFGTGPVCQDHFITYKVWDMNASTDVSEITIHYSCPTSIDELETGTFSAAFPNPATSSTTIHYTLNTFSKNTSVVLYDVFGKLIKETPIDEKEGSVLMDVEALDAGFYFYSFKIDERAVHTGKLIVN